MTVVPTVESIPHVIKGEVLLSGEVRHDLAGGDTFVTPAIDLDALVWPRTEPLPAAQVPVSEIIEVLAAVGEYLQADTGGLLSSAVESLALTSPYERRILVNSYENLWRTFLPDTLHSLLDGELGGAEVVDGWERATGVRGRQGRVRAYPTRLVHVLAGNAPGIAALTVARGALMKGVHLLKLPGNDLLTATAVLRGLAHIAPGHPVTRSFSAVYWRGGDDAIEGALFRPQFFDKVVAWGGDAAVRNAAKYMAPGFEIIAFDPKNSISLIGHEAFDSTDTIQRVASLGAIDSSPYNQEACYSSRFHFIEGSIEEVDRYCEALQQALGEERPLTSAVVNVSADLRDDVDALRSLAPFYRVFGAADGRGLVLRSDEPVGFSPSGKTVNVVMVPSLADAIAHVNVSTQTVSVYPNERKVELRDALASAGAQRVVRLGQSASMIMGLPHDGFYPLQRFVRWVNDED